ncbi:DoxX family membrane protein [Bradyrhizobium sp. CSA207]|uniref:DoxX family protein n=1 Tax=Bradyrhizobium sp. CSA207 TaxID=2698826 RepID=UPI0023B1CF06|nr:DoxX family protein [Bradyrhizobium sp. CSA207]MDE5445111.1 DoxX family membrane protein [Bradyrhizobium sp. CSA207]
MEGSRDWGLLVGRIALIALYAFSAAGKFETLDATAALLATKGYPLAMPLTIFVATVEMLGAICIAVGFYSRAVAIGLILYTLAATVTFHNFWMLEGAARQGLLIHFLKNVGLLGAFGIIASVGPGAFSLDALMRKLPRERAEVA